MGESSNVPYTPMMDGSGNSRAATPPTSRRRRRPVQNERISTEMLSPKSMTIPNDRVDDDDDSSAAMDHFLSARMEKALEIESLSQGKKSTLVNNNDDGDHILPEEINLLNMRYSLADSPLRDERQQQLSNPLLGAPHMPHHQQIRDGQSTPSTTTSTSSVVSERPTPDMTPKRDSPELQYKQDPVYSPAVIHPTTADVIELIQESSSPAKQAQATSSTLSSRSQQPRRGLYNPFSNYSPTRPFRKEIMGMSVFYNHDHGSLQQRSVPMNSPPYFPFGNYSSMNALRKASLDSESALEEYARHMRAELRYTEMIELALAAEEAAEAGEESFVARPFSYGLDDSMAMSGAVSEKSHTAVTMLDDDIVEEPRRSTVTASPKLARPERRRTKSLPTGNISPSIRPSVRLSSHKLTVMALRDVKEVFPSFRHFHKHLRTHLARDGVASKAMVFKEQEITPKSANIKCVKLDDGLDRTDKPDSATNSSSNLGFFRHLDVKEWVGKVGGGGSPKKNGRDMMSVEESKEENPMLGVGDILSEHLRSSTEVLTLTPKTAKTAPATVETGSFVSSSTASKKSKIGGRSSSNTVTTVTEMSTSSSSDENDGKSRSRRSHLPIAPRALFDDNDEGVEANHPSSQLTLQLAAPATPFGMEMKDDSGGDSILGGEFVTPARLRNIRRHSREDSSGSQVGLLIPTNAALESRDTIKLDPRMSLNQPLLGIDEGLRESDTSKDSSIVLPLHISQSSMDFHLLPVSEAGSTPHRCEEKELVSTEETPDHAVASKTKCKTHKLKVSVFASTPTTRKETKEGSSNRSEVPILQQSQVLHFPTADEVSDSIRTPQPECGCLTIDIPSTGSSFDTTESLVRPRSRPISPTAFGNSDDAYNWVVYKKESEEMEKQQYEQEKLTRHHRSASSGNSFREALNILSRLSPGKRNSQKTRKRHLYVRPRDNDEFLNNYLYCSKPNDGLDQPGAATVSTTTNGEDVCTDACQTEGRSNCAELISPDYCCASILGEGGIEQLASTTALMGARRVVASSSHRSFVSVGGNPTSTSRVETWFDRASEGFDSVLEQLTGQRLPGQQPPSYKNVSFQAPSLQKSIKQNGFHAKPTLGTDSNLLAIQESKSDDDFLLFDTSFHSRKINRSYDVIHSGSSLSSDRSLNDLHQRQQSLVDQNLLRRSLSDETKRHAKLALEDVERSFASSTQTSSTGQEYQQATNLVHSLTS